MTKQTIKAQADGRNGQIDFEIDLENNKISDGEDRRIEEKTSR